MTDQEQVNSEENSADNSDEFVQYSLSFMSEIDTLAKNTFSLRTSIENLIQVKDVTFGMQLPPKMLTKLLETVSAVQRSFCLLEQGVERVAVSFKLACPILFNETHKVEKIIQNCNDAKLRLENILKKIGKVEKKEIVLLNQAKWNAWQKILVSIALRNFHRNRWALYITEMRTERKSHSLSEYLAGLKVANLATTCLADLTETDPKEISFMTEKSDSCDWMHFVNTNETQTNLSANNELFIDLEGVKHQLKEIRECIEYGLWSEEWRYEQCFMIRIWRPLCDYSVSLIVDGIVHELPQTSVGCRDVVFPLCDPAEVKQVQVLFKKHNTVVLVGVIWSPMYLTNVRASVHRETDISVKSVDFDDIFYGLSGKEALHSNAESMRLHSVEDTWMDIETVDISLSRLWYCKLDLADESTLTDCTVEQKTCEIGVATDSNLGVDRAVSAKEDSRRLNSYSSEEYDKMVEKLKDEREFIERNYELQIDKLKATVAPETDQVAKKTKKRIQSHKTSSARTKEKSPEILPDRSKSAFYDIGKPSVKPFATKKWCLASQVIENQKITKYSALAHSNFYPMSYWNKTRENSPPSILNLPPVRKAKGIGIVNLYNTCIKINQR